MSLNVYVLYHVHPEDEIYDEDWKLIGIYDEESKAHSAILELKAVLGFRDHPEAFKIVEHEINNTSWKDGYIRS